MKQFRRYLILSPAMLLFFLAASAVLAFQTNQPASLVIGQQNMYQGGINQGQASAGASTLYWPGQVQVAGGKLFVADYHNNRVLIYNSFPQADNQAADIVIGQPDLESNFKNQYPPEEDPYLPMANTLHYPDGVQVFGDKLLIADTLNNRTLIFDTVPDEHNASADLPIGQDSLVDAYIANRGGGPGPDTTFSPQNLCIYEGSLFVADRFNNRVLIYHQIPTEFNVQADVVVGQPGMWSGETNQGSLPYADTLNEPTGVFAGGGRLFVSDSGNNRVLVFNNIPDSDGAEADVVIGQPDMVSVEPNRGQGTPGADTLFRPTGSVYFDGTRLFIPDSDNHRVLIFNSLPTVDGAAADFVLGQEDMQSRLLNGVDPDSILPGDPPPPPTGQSMNLPNSVFLYQNNLLVADAHNNRVLIFEEGTPTPTPPGYKTPTPLPSPPPTATPSPSPVPTSSPSPSLPPTLTPTPTPTVTPSPPPTLTPSPSPTRPPSPPPTATSTPAPTLTPSPAPTLTPSPQPTVSITPEPTPSATPPPSATPTASPPAVRRVRGDYSGDGTSDPAIYRPSSGLWAVRGLTRVYFGGSGDFPVPLDYTGDGTTDIAIFRPGSGLWAVRGVTRVYFGGTGDDPVPGYYSGEDGARIGIFRQSSGLWALRGVTRVYFGSSNDLPLSGDFSGDGIETPGIFRPNSGLWALRGVTRIYFGSMVDRPLTGDFSGDGTETPGIYRPAAGLWALRGVTRVYFGGDADTPVPADFSGAGRDGVAIFRPATGLWAARGVTRLYFGSSSDIPLTGLAGVGPE